MSAFNLADHQKRSKKPQLQRNAIFSPISLALMACGGGSESSNNVSTYSGHAIKGPLQNATVFADLNKNGKLDANEPNTLSSSDGSFSFNTSATDFEIVVTTTKDTIDTSSGESFDGLTLKAPIGADVVSPLTTMVTESNLSKEKLADILGLGDIDVLAFNPFSEGVDATQALKVEKAAHQTQLTLNAIAASGKEAGLSDENAKALAIEAMSEKFEQSSSNGKKIDLSSEDTLKDLVSTAETKVAGKGGSKADFAKNSSVLIDQVKVKNIDISKLNSLTSSEAASVFANTATISNTLVTEIKTQTTSTIEVDINTSSSSTNVSSTSSSSCVSSTSTSSTTDTTPVTSLARCDCESTTTTSTSASTTTTPVSLASCVSTATSTDTTTTTATSDTSSSSSTSSSTSTTSTADSSTASTSVDTTTTTTDTTTTTATPTTIDTTSSSSTSSSTSTSTTSTTTTTVAALSQARDAHQIDSVWGTNENDIINVGAMDDIVHTSAGYDVIILGSGNDTLIVEKGNGHTVIKDFDATEDQLVLAADVFIEDTQIIDDSLHLYTNFGGQLEFENIGDIGAMIM